MAGASARNGAYSAAIRVQNGAWLLGDRMSAISPDSRKIAGVRQVYIAAPFPQLIASNIYGYPGRRKIIKIKKVKN